MASVGAGANDVVAINAGGAASGNFSADMDYGPGTWTYTTSKTIATTSIALPAAQTVYQTEREGSTISYAIPGLTPGASYTVGMSFAELWWTSAGKRVFNVTLNGTKVLSNFDVFAAAGAANKAIVESFTATANSTGTITIVLTAITDNAAVQAIEVTPAVSPTPAPSTAPSGSVLINAGGSAAGSFIADADFSASGSWTYATGNAINTAGVVNPAPATVYQSQRTGYAMTYTIPGLTGGSTYNVRLDFAELYFTTSGQRVFNVSINNTNVLTNFDIVAKAGAGNKASAQTFTAKASPSGTITIAFSSITNYAVINGIEVVPATAAATAFNDYATFGYDNGHDVYNPNSTALTPASVPNLHLAWQASLNDFNTQTQPIVATEIPGHAGVIYVGGTSGNVQAFDALTGSLIWSRNLGQSTFSSPACGGGTNYFGVGGSAAYDPASKSLYVVGNYNSSLSANSNNELFHLDGATGAILGQVNVSPTAAGPTETNFSHTSVTLSNGLAYVGTASTCDISSWRGRVAAVNVPAMTLANTFFTLWDPQNARGAGAQAWGGGGVWGWGGVSVDPSGNVLTGVGNADAGGNGTISAPFASAPTEYGGYAESLLELSSSLSSVIADHHPTAQTIYGGDAVDLDVQGTPLVFNPAGNGCGTMVALQSKSGELTLYNENNINNGYVAQYQMGPSNYDGSYLGGPAYSAATGLVYANVAASTSPSLFPPGLIAVNPGCGSPSVAWHASFGADSSGNGIPRAVPAPSAGGVIFAGSVFGSGGGLWAVDASTGTVLNNASPILQTSGNLRMPATLDGNWVFVLDNNGNLYGMTTDPSYQKTSVRRRAADSRQRRSWTRVTHG